MLTEADISRIEQNKKIYNALIENVPKREIGDLYNIPETSVTAYSWMYKDHINMYNNNFIYKAFVDDKKVVIRRKSLTRMSNVLIKCYKDKESLTEAIGNKSVLNIKYIGPKAYKRLKTIFEVED